MCNFFFFAVIHSSQKKTKIKPPMTLTSLFRLKIQNLYVALTATRKQSRESSSTLKHKVNARVHKTRKYLHMNQFFIFYSVVFFHSTSLCWAMLAARIYMCAQSFQGLMETKVSWNGTVNQRGRKKWKIATSLARYAHVVYVDSTQFFFINESTTLGDKWVTQLYPSKNSLAVTKGEATFDCFRYAMLCFLIFNWNLFNSVFCSACDI